MPAVATEAVLVIITLGSVTVITVVSVLLPAMLSPVVVTVAVFVTVLVLGAKSSPVMVITSAVPEATLLTLQGDAIDDTMPDVVVTLRTLTIVLKDASVTVAGMPFVLSLVIWMV